MALSINTNVSALTAQRNLGINSMESATSLSKLSSGSRIPSAKFDAAGLAVGTKLGAEVESLRTASQNASQAGSMLQIADGALATASDVLVRMKALAVQSDSGQLSDSERNLLNQEFVALRNEIDRIAQDTSFNGTALLDGGDDTVAFTESNAGSLEAAGINLGFDVNTLGADEVFRVSYEFTAATVTDGDGIDDRDVGNLTVTNLTTGISQTIDIADVMANNITAVAADTVGEGAFGDLDFGADENLVGADTVQVGFDALGVTLTLDSRFDVDADFNADLTGGTAATTTDPNSELGGTADVAFLNATGVTGGNFDTMINGADFSDGTLAVQVDTTANANEFGFAATAGIAFSLDGVNFSADLTGASVVDATANDQVYVRAGGAGTSSDADGEAFMRIDLNNLTTTGNAGTDGTLDIDLNGLFRAQETAGTANTFNYKVGTGVNAEDDISITINNIRTTTLGISTSTIETEANAALAITALDTAIDTVSSRRADIGSNQSRLDFAAASVNVAIENTTAAQAGIMDADISQEMTEFTSKQVLVQAGVSMLAQANQQPGLLLQLLQ